MRNSLYVLVASLSLVSAASAEEAPTNKELVCSTKEDIVKQLKGRGFSSLVSFVNETGTKQLIWVSPTEAVVTAENDEASCLVALMSKPTFNATTIESIHGALKQQKE